MWGIAAATLIVGGVCAIIFGYVIARPRLQPNDARGFRITAAGFMSIFVGIGMAAARIGVTRGG
jgi:hypothetical protein